MKTSNQTSRVIDRAVNQDDIDFAEMANFKMVENSDRLASCLYCESQINVLDVDSIATHSATHKRK